MCKIKMICECGRMMDELKYERDKLDDFDVEFECGSCGCHVEGKVLTMGYGADTMRGR